MASVRRIRAVGTGVAGAPDYLNFFYDADVADPQDCADNARALLVNMAFIQAESYFANLEDIATVLDSVTGQPTATETVDGGAPIQGSSSGQALPAQVQVGVKLLTGAYQAGRQIQGRISIPAVTTGISGGGSGPNMAATGITGMNTALAAAKNDGVGWCVWSRKSGTLALIASATVSPTWFTLRSRLT